MTTYAQLLGWHRLAVAPSLQVFSDGVRALFNAGENVQRFHLEHKLHLSRTTDVLLTSVSTTTSAGLPGLLLSLEGAGVKHIRLWGPARLQEFVEVVTSSFAGLRSISIEYRIAQPPPTEQEGRCSRTCNSSSSPACTSSSTAFLSPSSSAPSSSTGAGASSPSSCPPSPCCSSSSSSYQSVHFSSSVGASPDASSPKPAVVAQWSTSTQERGVGNLKRGQAKESAAGGCCEVPSELLQADQKEDVVNGRGPSLGATGKSVRSARAGSCCSFPASTSSDISASSRCGDAFSGSSGMPSTESTPASHGTIGAGLEIEAVLLPCMYPHEATAALGRYRSNWQTKGEQFAAHLGQGVCWQKNSTRRVLSRRYGEDGRISLETTVGKKPRVVGNPLLPDFEKDANSSDTVEDEDGPGEKGESSAAEREEFVTEMFTAGEEAPAEGRTCEGGEYQRSRGERSEAKSPVRFREYVRIDEGPCDENGAKRRVVEIPGGASNCEEDKSHEQPCSSQIFWAEGQAEEDKSAHEETDFHEALKKGGLWQRGPPPDLPLHEGGSGGDCVAYILRGQNVPGKFHPEKARELGVPVGPLFSRLKSGAAVKLSNGVVVKPEDVCDAPSLGQVVLVLHCLNPLQATYARERLSLDLERLTYVFHMTPWNVARTAEYEELVRALTGPHTMHILCDRSHEAVEVSPFIHSSKLQEFLHLLMPPVFPRPPAPLRWETAVDFTERPTTTSSVGDRGLFSVFPALTRFDMASVSKRNVNEEEALNTFRPAFSTKRLSTLQFFSQTYEQCKKLLAEASATRGPAGVPCTADGTCSTTKEVGGRAPPGSSSPSGCTGPREIASAVTVVPSGGANLSTTTADRADLQKEEVTGDFEQINSGINVSEGGVSGSEAPESEGRATESETVFCLFPSLKILGTGAAAPSQYRNVSGLLLSIRRDLSVIMDCGEGSLSQIYSMCQSWREFCEIIASVRIIFISHLHADHHLGICSFLLLRGQLFPALRPPLVVAPPKLEGWLHFYSHAIACIPHTFIESSHFASNSTRSALASAALQMQGCAGCLTLKATEVEHIPHSFGVRVNMAGNEHPTGAYSVVFSGDTRPCDSLFDLAKDATLLIHEATFEDSLINEAIKKRHSSLTEVLAKAAGSGCKTVVLTHFSQRYPTMPVLSLQATENQTAGSDGSLSTPSLPDNCGETLVSSLLAGTQDPPFRLLFAFDCMNIPLQHVERLARCFKYLPGAINELFAPS